MVPNKMNAEEYNKLLDEADEKAIEWRKEQAAINEAKQSEALWKAIQSGNMAEIVNIWKQNQQKQ